MGFVFLMLWPFYGFLLARSGSKREMSNTNVFWNVVCSVDLGKCYNGCANTYTNRDYSTCSFFLVVDQHVLLFIYYFIILIYYSSTHIVLFGYHYHYSSTHLVLFVSNYLLLINSFCII